eukprot:TRINITY_DN121_c0_g1_i1.p1 TRINITY_DN121_c0_g1~~TRINITY_DN121_c0_g1_i1.p1  ORF type:complete len:277 (-),score=94.39 TRINITY_DN121_c0_g1_i1:165-995(-)
MAPVGFGDLAKTAKDILDNDFQTSGYQFKAKQKTSVNSAVVTTAVDLWPKEGVQTPGKLTWKIPNPVGVMGFSIDKLEMDKDGKFKLETSLDKTMHKVDGLKIDVKSDLASIDTVKTCLTFTGLADKRFQLEAPLTTPETFTLEGTGSFGAATIGVKLTKDTVQKPDIGARFVSGPFFAAVLATKKLSTFSAFASYTVSDALKVAATCEQGKDLKGGVACQYSLAPQTTLKVKVTQDQVVSAGVKQDIQKGFTVLAGGKYDVQKGTHSYGLQLSVE